MKTVMKKICCLLLVAVLMVGYLPFQAFAATDVTVNLITQTGGTTIDTTNITINDENNVAAEVEAAARAKWGAHYDFQAASSDIKSGNLVYARMTPKACDKSVNCPSPIDHYPTCGTNCTGAFGCPTETHKSGCLSQYTCPTCGAVGQHLNTDCPELYETCCNVKKGSAHREGCVYYCTGLRDCTNAAHKEGCLHALCDLEGCTLNEGHTGEHTGVPCDDPYCNLWLNHDGKHSYLCPNEGCNLPVGHSGNCSNNPAYTAGSSTLKVYANLYTGTVKTGVIELIRYEGISSNTVVYSFLAAREDQIRAKIPAGYDWTGHIYDKDNKNVAELANADVGTGRTVHINLYSDADYVYVYVHNSRSYSNIRVIQLDGKKAGETITRSEVKKAVSKYYNISSMSMYSEDGWDKYVKNQSVQAVDSLTAEDGITEVHVRISGSAKSTSTSTADSSNYKTGDMIFMPAFILVASAGALAAVLYLKKKQAVR